MTAVAVMDIESMAATAVHAKLMAPSQVVTHEGKRY